MNNISGVRSQLNYLSHSIFNANSQHIRITLMVLAIIGLAISSVGLGIYYFKSKKVKEIIPSDGSHSSSIGALPKPLTFSSNGEITQQTAHNSSKGIPIDNDTSSSDNDTSSSLRKILSLKLTKILPLNQTSPASNNQTVISSVKDIKSGSIPSISISSSTKGLVKLSYSEIIRMIYWGSSTTARLTEKELQDATESFRKYKLDTKKQQLFSNTNSDVIYMDFNDFGRSNQLFEPHLQSFIRYLVLEGEIFAYRQARCGYGLFLNEEGVKTDNSSEIIYNKNKLEEIDTYMQSLPLPNLQDFLPIEPSILKDILDAIMGAHFQRINNDYIACLSLGKHSHNKDAWCVLDKLVEQGIIHSWNKNNLGFVIKIKESDDNQEFLNSAQWKEWRDKQKLEEEKKFQLYNRLSFDIDALDLDDSDKDVVRKLTEELNQRVAYGHYSWSEPGNSALKGARILNALKNANIIHHYTQRGYGNSFEIGVQAQDK